MIEIKGKYNEAKIFTDVVDSASIAQVQELCNQEFTAGGRPPRQCRLVRLPDGLHRAEMLPQLRLPLGAQTGNAVQYGAHGALGMVLVVIGDGETVGLLLDLADEGEHRLIVHNADLPALWGDQRPGAVAVILHHAEDGNMHAHPGAHALGDPRVRDAAVDEHDVRQGAELLIAVQIALDAAREHLLHGRVVVRVGRQALDLESPVGTLLGLCALIDDHRCNDVARAGVRDIVGLHALGRLGE